MAISSTTTEAATNVWKNLHYLRNLCRLSDSEISRSTGIGRTPFAKKMNGQIALTLPEALILADFFAVPLEVLQLPRREATAWISDHWDDVESSVRNRCISLSYGFDISWRVSVPA